MKEKIFSVFFLAVPALSMILLTTIKIAVKNTDFWTAFESHLPIIVFYYVIVRAFWFSIWTGRKGRLPAGTLIHNNKSRISIIFFEMRLF